jgi:hypothetical protein
MEYGADWLLGFGFLMFAMGYAFAVYLHGKS